MAAPTAYGIRRSMNASASAPTGFASFTDDHVAALAWAAQRRERTAYRLPDLNFSP